MEKLKKNNFIKREGPVVLIIMDGVGIGDNGVGDALKIANTPTLDNLQKNYLNLSIKAHGTAVGLPSDGDMGNSEVGHNALGAGRIFDQGAKLVKRSIENKEMFKTDIWNKITTAGKSNTMHLIGLLSDGNVHSHIDQLFEMINQASKDNVKKLRVHVLLDGRDVPDGSAETYIEQLENFLEQFNNEGKDYRIGSGGGRMITTMDRYEADWSIVERGWNAHVLGTAKPFESALEAIKTFRFETPGILDQNLPSFTIVEDKKPIGTIEDGDSVIFFNFRGDRSIQISRAFDKNENIPFDRKRTPNVVFAGIMQYDGDLNIPKNYLVEPPKIDRTMSEFLANENLKQFAISETQKFGHVTYFWNGNKTGKFNDELEDYLEIPSDKIEFDERPWMKAAEITDKVIEAIESQKYDFIRLNYANGDMVGHTGNLDSTIVAAETVDLSLARLLPILEKFNGMAIITADHGNLDEMFEIDKKTKEIIIDKKTGKQKPKTSHTLNPVPVIFFDPNFKDEYNLSNIENPGLANIAASLFFFLGYESPKDYEKSLITLK